MGVLAVLVGGLDLQHGAKNCARELASVVSSGLSWSPVVTRLLDIKIEKRGRGSGRYLDFEFC